MAAVALLVAVLGLLVAAPALAHDAGGAAQGIVRVPWGWNAEVWLWALLALSLVLYLRGLGVLWRRAGVGHGIRRAGAASFLAGWCAVLLALASPLDAWGSLLFSAHMLQHEVLMVLAAPLLVVGSPLAAWLWAFPSAWRVRIGAATRQRTVAAAWSAITRPTSAWALHALALWLWHVPTLFEAALHGEPVHIAQHVSFLATALLFWWTVLGRSPAHSRGTALASLFTTMLHTSALGALLTLAPTPWYAHYAALGGVWGLDPVEDQSLGGLVMWVPGGISYLGAALLLVSRLLGQRSRLATG